MTDLAAGRSGETVRTEARGGVLTVWLNRPAAAHAHSQLMRDELASLWRSVAADGDVRAVVVTGTGDRFFCAGMDLKEAGLPEAPRRPAGQDTAQPRH
jgi:enoyl-CoA hydratase/carnithine racemase